jgi:hypothetical protein
MSNDKATVTKPDGFTLPEIRAFIAEHGLPTEIRHRFGGTTQNSSGLDEASVAEQLTHHEGWWPNSEQPPVIFKGPVLEGE